MDNQPRSGGAAGTTVRFSPDLRRTWLAGGGLVAALLVCLLTTDVEGRLLAGVAGLVLLGYLVSDLMFRPRLVASVEGIVICSPFVRARLAWSQVEHIRADTRLRFGLRSTTLEIDAGRTLAVLSRRALGAEPAEVADLVCAFRPLH